MIVCSAEEVRPAACLCSRTVPPFTPGKEFIRMNPNPNLPVDLTRPIFPVTRLEVRAFAAVRRSRPKASIEEVIGIASVLANGVLLDDRFGRMCLSNSPAAVMEIMSVATSQKIQGFKEFQTQFDNATIIGYSGLADYFLQEKDSLTCFVMEFDNDNRRVEMDRVLYNLHAISHIRSTSKGKRKLPCVPQVFSIMITRYKKEGFPYGHYSQVLIPSEGTGTGTNQQTKGRVVILCTTIEYKDPGLSDLMEDLIQPNPDLMHSPILREATAKFKFSKEGVDMFPDNNMISALRAAEDRGKKEGLQKGMEKGMEKGRDETIETLSEVFASVVNNPA